MGGGGGRAQGGGGRGIWQRWELRFRKKWISDQLALKYNCRKWHSNQSASRTGMWLGKQSFAFQTLPNGFVDALNDHQLSWLFSRYVCVKMIHGSLCVKIQAVPNRPTGVRYREQEPFIFRRMDHWQKNYKTKRATELVTRTTLEIGKGSKCHPWDSRWKG